LTCGCGMLIFLKATDSLIWGPGDIIAVEIATVRNKDGSEDEETTGYRMGLYYCSSGLGVFLGPQLANWFSDAERPISLQRACIVAIFIAMTGWIIAAHAPTYNYFLLSQWWSGIGYGILLSYSTLLLQLLVDKAMLGRVLSLEFFFYVMAETLSSSLTGPLYDHGFTTSDLCLFGAGLALITLIFWTTYHMCGLGAAKPQLNSGNCNGTKSKNNGDMDYTFSHVTAKIVMSKASEASDGQSVTRRKLKSDKELSSNPEPSSILDDEESNGSYYP
jgi:MFS family permease